MRWDPLTPRLEKPPITPGYLWLLIVALVVGLVLLVIKEAVGAETGGWIIALGTPLQSETACNLDLASLANVVPSRTRLKCIRVEGK